MAFETYVIESTNQINTLLIQSEVHAERSQDCLLEAAVVGCRTLKQLCDDPGFDAKLDLFADVRLIVGFMQKSSARDKRSQRTRVQQFREIIEKPSHFERFLELEREVLLKGGVKRDVVDLLIEESRNSLEDVKARAKPPSEVIETVRLLRDRACVLSADLVSKADAERRWEGIKERIKRIMLGLGGASLVGLNASTLAPSVGITAAGAAVSAAIGVTVITNAAADKSKARGATT